MAVPPPLSSPERAGNAPADSSGGSDANVGAPDEPHTLDCNPRHRPAWWPDGATNKPRWRAAARAARDAFVANRQPGIAAPLALLARFDVGVTIAGYMAVGSEADPAPILAAAIARGCTIALPRIERADPAMRFLIWDGCSPLAAGPRGLLQPERTARVAVPDIILTPLLCFSDALDRLGQGAGYYDRAFAALPAASRVGVAWSIQQAPDLPVDSWDVPLHAVATERDWIVATTHRGTRQLDPADPAQTGPGASRR